MVNKILSSIAAVFLFSVSAQMAPGDLDPTFGPVGFVANSLSPRSDRAFALARQSDGKIVAVGDRDQNSGIAVVRYNLDGTLDVSFDGDGIAIIASGNGTHEGRGVAIQADGRIVVVGSSGFGPFTVVRLNADGSLDTSFSGDGIVSADGLTGTPRAVAIQSDGRIVTAGEANPNFFNSDFAFVRLNSDGTFDTTFDGDGRLLVNVGTGSDVARAVAIQSDGKILAAGESDAGGNSLDFGLVRLNTNGSLDTTFDGDGKVLTSFGPGAIVDLLYGLAVEPNGRITATGTAGDGTIRGVGVARYNSNGSLDTAFSGDGKVVTQVTANNVGAGLGVAVQPDGKPVVVGSTALEMIVLRYNLDGTLDTTFSGDGRALLTVYSTGATAGRAVIVEPDGRIAVAGDSSRGSDADFVLARFNADGSPVAAAGTFGYVITSPFDSPARPTVGQSVAIAPDGRIVVGANQLFDQERSEHLILRYTAEGGLDGTFSSNGMGNGIATIPVSGATSSQLTSVVVQPDGKTLAVINYEAEGAGEIGFYVGRLNADGTRDTTFGENGTVRFNLTNGGGLAQDIALQADGKIVVAGGAVSFQTLSFDFAVYRLMPNGAVDTSFGTGGRSTVAVGAGNDLAFSVAVQADGRIVAGGSSNFDPAADGQAAAIRLMPAGNPDQSFGSQGIVTTQLGAFSDTITDVKLQTDGKLVASGIRCNVSGCGSQTGVVIRYGVGGLLDTSFDADGIVPLQVTGVTSSDLTAVAIDGNGKILASGSAITSNQSDNLVVRFNPNGSFDTSYGSGGIVINDLGGTEQVLTSSALQPDGKLVAAGFSRTGTREDIALWRYLGDAPAAADVTVSGRVLTPDGRDLRNAVVTITDPQGVTRNTITSSFGFYTFGQVATGQSYTIRVNSRRYRFTARTVAVNGSLADVDFVGLE